MLHQTLVTRKWPSEAEERFRPDNLLFSTRCRRLTFEVLRTTFPSLGKPVCGAIRQPVQFTGCTCKTLFDASLQRAQWPRTGIIENISVCGNLGNTNPGEGSRPAITDCNNSLLPGDPFSDLYSATVPFQWGFQYFIDVDLTVFAEGDFDGPTDATSGSTADLSHSTYWAGITKNVTSERRSHQIRHRYLGLGSQLRQFVRAVVAFPEPDRCCFWLAR